VQEANTILKGDSTKISIVLFYMVFTGIGSSELVVENVDNR